MQEKNLAYGGQALIEGVLMRGQKGYAFTIKQNNGVFYKEKKEYIPVGKRIKFLGLPFIRGIVGLFENMILGMKILNKSADIIYPEEKKETSNLSMIILLILSTIIALFIFTGVPYFLPKFFNLDYNNNPISYNIVAGIFRLIMFFLYLIFISLFKDSRRLFGYHGAEHMTIHAYEAKNDLIVENVKKFSRLHPRCGTSFIFIVFLVTLIVFPFFSFFYNTQAWYNNLHDLNFIGLHAGKVVQRLIHIASHIFIGMPIVAGISYELLKISGKYQKNPFVRLFILPGLFFQLFTTKKPDDDMIKAAILSLKMILGEESQDIERKVTDQIKPGINMAMMAFILPFLFIL